MSEQPKSYEELINEKSVVEKIAEFFKTYKVALFIGIGFICFFGIILIMHVTKFSSSQSLVSIIESLGASDILIAVLSFVAVVMFVINIYFYNLFNKHKELPHVTKVSRTLVTLITLFIAVIVLLIDSTKIWIVLLLAILCIINHYFSLTYKEKWDMPYYLRNIFGLQVIGVIIAFFQALIAWPQLKSAWEAATSDDIDKLQQTLSEFYNHVENYVIVDIPDSLMNDEVKQARYCQKQIYTYSLALVNQDWNFDMGDVVDMDTIDWYDVEKQSGLDKDLAKDLLKTFQNVIGFQRNKKKLANGMELLGNLAYQAQSITEYYNKCPEDSVIIAIQVNAAVISEKICSEIAILTDKFVPLDSINNVAIDALMQIIQNDGNTLLLQRKLSEISNKEQQLLQELIKSNVLKEIFELSDELCFDYISALNLIQLKYAYDVELYASKD